MKNNPDNVKGKMSLINQEQTSNEGSAAANPIYDYLGAITFNDFPSRQIDHEVIAVYLKFS